MKDYIGMILFAVISIISFYYSIYYKDYEFQLLFRVISLINGIGFGLAAISGYTG